MREFPSFALAGPDNQTDEPCSDDTYKNCPSELATVDGARDIGTNRKRQQVFAEVGHAVDPDNLGGKRAGAAEPEL